MATADRSDKLTDSACLSLSADPGTPVCGVSTELLLESLSDMDVKIHNNSPEHVLVEPTTLMKNRTCSIHKEVLKYYCYEDAVCLCVSCGQNGKHEGHQVEPLEKASQKMKEKLRAVLQKLTSDGKEIEKRTRSLEDHKTEIQGEEDRMREMVTVLFNNLREQLDTQGKRVLSEISRQKDKKNRQVSDQIRQLEIQKKMLSTKILHIEDICSKMDPSTILEGWEWKKAGNVAQTGHHKDRRRSKGACTWGYLDEGHVTVTLHQVLAGIMTRVRVGRCVPEASGISLDENTAGDYVVLSRDSKTASWSQINQKRLETPERFCFYQVLSTRGFSSGQHYWEVDTSSSGNWMLGMAYPSIDRKGHQAFLGFSDKSWCLGLRHKDYSLMHNSKGKPLKSDSPLQRLGIYLDYEAGRLSFYQLSDPIRHLHTFGAAFSEPLHAAFFVEHEGWVKITS
ncbi:E3 ubiquitin-protein ligase TRIM39-like [Spea bombifrons]|uniref:E3 ubiquitin-protein ligase TRIM39-like n=1 Tax=Spea bombifrons TaxID=233779 RepID=UPI00234A2B9E|nr:E3 ubiquitin-protein ligase TRIM39-like [Spea bombifrons]